MQVLVTVIALGAASAWLVAVASAIGVMLVAPAGQRMAVLFDLGWWKFAEISRRTGPAAAIHLTRYRNAFLAFFAFVLAGAAAGTMAGSAN